MNLILSILISFTITSFMSIYYGTGRHKNTIEHHIKTVEDSVKIKMLAKFNLNSDKTFNRVIDYPLSVISHKDSLFMLFYTTNRIVVISKKDGRAKTSNLVNSIISEYAAKYNGLKELLVTDDCYYVSFLNAVIVINRQAQKVTFELISNDVIEHISVDSLKTIILFTSNDITHYNLNRQKIFNLKSSNPFTSKFNNNENGDVIIGNELSLMSYNIYTKKLVKLKISSNSIVFKEPYLGSTQSDKLFYYEYDLRSAIYIINKTSSNIETIYNISSLKLKPSSKDIQEEEGSPKFTLIPQRDDPSIYILIMEKGILMIYKILPN